MAADAADFFGGLATALRSATGSDWRLQARPEQIAPLGGWTTWVFCGGRGAGKTRSGGEWVQERVAAGARYVHLIAPTVADVRDVMLEGPAGILSIASPYLRPTYQPSLRRLSWPNGCIGLLFSADEPDRLRGPQCDTAWVDELCAMRTAQDVLDNLYFGLRVGKDPRALITTTPRPLKCFRALLARDGEDVVVTRSSSYANRQNLAPSFFASIVGKYEGTRLGRQELEAQLLLDVPGALFDLENLDLTRVERAPSDLERVVVGVDPAGSSTEGADETGIVVAARGRDTHGYVLTDLSGVMTPLEWARAAVKAYHEHRADLIAAERNYGGELVSANIASVDPNVPVKLITSSRGKVLRAEPVASLFAQRRCHLVGSHPALEDQLCRFTSDWDRSRDGSPDRIDAMVFAMAELLIQQHVPSYWDVDLLFRDDDRDEEPQA
jgi:phage terminase large subunit-like protein